jgi:hypothetical protein
MLRFAVFSLPLLALNFGASCSRPETTGAVTGAVGGAFGGALYGGFVGEAAGEGTAEGAATGAAAGAVIGGTAGALRANQISKTADINAQILSQTVVGDMGLGVDKLTRCQHGAALREAKAARSSRNPERARGGLWLEALTRADLGGIAGAQQFVPMLIAGDPDFSTETQVEDHLQTLLADLGLTRRQSGIPEVCAI